MDREEEERAAVVTQQVGRVEIEYVVDIRVTNGYFHSLRGVLQTYWASKFKMQYSEL